MMMTKGKWLVCIAGTVFLMGLITPVIFAQFGGPPWPEQEKSPAPKEKKWDTQESKREDYRKEDVKEILETMRVWKMTKALELTEEQSLKLFPKIHESDKLKEELGKKRMEIFTQLEKFLKEEKPDQTKISELLNTMDKAESEMRAKEDKLKEELKTILSTVQQAKFYIFQKNFEEDVRRMIAELRGLRGGSMGQMREMPSEKGEEKPFPQKK